MTSLALALLLSLPKPPAPPPPPPPPSAVGSRAAHDDSDDDRDDDGDRVDLDVRIQDGGVIVGSLHAGGAADGGADYIGIGPSGIQIHGKGHHHSHHHAGSGKGDRVVTGNVTIHAGEKAQDVVAIGGSIELDPGALVHDAVAVGGSIKAGSGSVIEGDAVAVGGSVELDPGAKVVGDATAVGGTVEQEAGSDVGGDHVSVGLPGLGMLLTLVTGVIGIGVISPIWLVGSVMAKLIVFLSLGLLLLALWPRRLDRLSEEMFRIPGRSVLLGALSLLAVPVLTILLVVTIVGIPLVPVEIVALALMSATGFSALALAVGRRLPFAKGQTAIQLGIGWVLLILVFAIPIMGTLLLFACWIWVFGAVVATRFGREAPLLPPSPTDAAPPPAAAAAP
jgi:hypothetical protein